MPSKNGEVDFQQFNNDSRLKDSGDVGMGMPEFNDFRGNMGGAQGQPMFNDYRQSNPDNGDVMNVMWDRPIGGVGGRSQGGAARRRGSRKAQ